MEAVIERMHADDGRLLGDLAKLTGRLREVSQPEQAMAELVGGVTQLAGVEAASVLLLNEDRGQLVFHAATGPAGEALAGMAFDASLGIAGHTARTRRPVVVADAACDEHFLSLIDRRVGFATHSVLCVPILRQQRVLGVVEALNRKDGGSFGDVAVNLLQLAGDVAAMKLAEVESTLLRRRHQFTRQGGVWHLHYTFGRTVESATLSAACEGMEMIHQLLSHPRTPIPARLLLHERCPTDRGEAALAVRLALDDARRRIAPAMPHLANHLRTTILPDRDRFFYDPMGSAEWEI